jgi:hypothetical protein
VPRPPWYELTAIAASSHRVTTRRFVLNCLLLLQAGCHGYFAELVHLDHKIDRSATDLTVFDIFLGFDGTVNQ